MKITKCHLIKILFMFLVAGQFLFLKLSEYKFCICGSTVVPKHIETLGL